MLLAKDGIKTEEPARPRTPSRLSQLSGWVNMSAVKNLWRSMSRNSTTSWLATASPSRISTMATRNLQPLLMVGFNRRFSPVAQRMKEIVSQRWNPLMALYRVNAGYLPPDHWVHGPEGGGRVIGEACHMFDLFNFLVDVEVEAVCAEALAPRTEHVSGKNNVSVTMRYTDGSVCTLLYTALGERGLAKEYIEVYVDGKVLVVDDFKALRLYGLEGRGWSAPVANKGHLQTLQCFAKSMQDGENWPIPMEQLVSATRVSFLVSDLNPDVLSEQIAIGRKGS